MLIHVKWPWALLVAGLMASPCVGQQSSGAGADPAQPPVSQGPNIGQPGEAPIPGSQAVGASSSGVGSASTPPTPAPTASSGQPSVTTAFNPDLSALFANGDHTSLTFNISESYHSNVTGSSSSAFAGRGTLSDFVTAPNLQAGFARTFGRGNFFLGGDIGYVDYARHSILNRSNIVLDGGGVAAIGLCQTNLQGSFSRGQANQGDLAVALGAGRPIVTSDLIQNTLGSFSATCGHASGLAPTVSASVSSLQNTSTATGLGIDLPLQALSARTYSVSSGLAYRTASLGVLTATGQYTHTDYPGRPLGALGLSTGAPGSPTESFSALGGGVNYVTPAYLRVTGSASLNYESLQPDNGLGKSFNGLTYSASLGYAVTAHIAAQLSVSHQTAPSNNLDALFVVRQNYGASAIYTLGNLSSLTLGVSKQDMNYDDILLPQLAQITYYKIDRVYLTASRRIGRRLRLELSLSYRSTNTNLTAFNYSDAVVGLAASSSF